MTSKMKSFLGGAAFAALLIVPAAADTNWLTLPQKSFDVHSVKVEDLIGSLVVNVKDSGPVTVDVSGIKERVNDLEISNHDGKVLIAGSTDGQKVWDWHSWFDFSAHEHAKPGRFGLRHFRFLPFRRMKSR